MPMTVAEQLQYLLDYDLKYMSQLEQDGARNAIGLNTINLAEKANMLGLMRNWISDHEIGTTEDVFTEEFKEFAKPLHSRKGKEALQKAADEATSSGGNALHAQIKAAAALRQSRSNVFDWDPKKQYNAGSVALANLEKGLEANRQANLKAMRRGEDRHFVDFRQAKPLGAVSQRDVTGLGLSALQACTLDALLHKFGQLRMLFTTAKLVEGSLFLRVLASSQNLYDRGFIMNPMILRANAPSVSPINWDIRLNDFFLHAGIEKRAVFVFATSTVDYETFLDINTKHPEKLQKMIATPVGSSLPKLGLRFDKNYPVKPGGSEILTLLEYGYDVEQQEGKFYSDAKLGFVMVPGKGAGPRKERFLQMHASFTQEKYNRLIAFARKLSELGIYR